MSVERGLGVAEDFVIDAFTIRAFKERIADDGHIAQKLIALAWAELVQVACNGFGKQQAVARHDLMIADGHPSGRQAGNNKRVGAISRCSAATRR